MNDINMNTKWKHFKTVDGNTTNKITVNGYNYGDTLLEDVLFDIEIKEGELEIKVQNSSKEYFSQLNEEHWYSTILETFEEGEPIFTENGEEMVLILENENISNLTNNLQSQNIVPINNSLLNELGIDNDDVDPEFEKNTEKLLNIQKFIEDKIQEKTDELSKLNQYVDRNLYWSIFYTLELVSSIKNKYFNREYMTDPKIRLNNIKIHFEEVITKYSAYLESIKFKVKTQEDTEAFEQEYFSREFLNEYFPIEKIEPILKNSESLKNTVLSDEKKSKLSDILRKLEAGEILEKEKTETSKKELTEFEKADMKGKIVILYDKVIKKAIELDGEDDGLIKTYINGLYNPKTTSLDDRNLILNLNIVSRMQDFGVMNWVFDDKRVKVSNTEINLTHKWWDKILNENTDDDTKYSKIVEKDLNLAFYTSLITSLLKNADKLSFTKTSMKMKKIVAEGEFSKSKEELLLDTILKKTHEGSILFITPDMEKWVKVDKVINDELGDRGQIKYLGIWDKRHIFVINVDNINGLKGYSNEIIFLNKGNSYVLNPEKPIVYFNVIENPFLERPLIKWFAGADFDIFMDKSARLRVDTEYLE